MRITINASDVAKMSNLNGATDRVYYLRTKFYEESSAFWVGLGPQIQREFDASELERANA